MSENRGLTLLILLVFIALWFVFVHGC